jgi:hypothetical protein
MNERMIRDNVKLKMEEENEPHRRFFIENRIFGIQSQNPMNDDAPEHVIIVSSCNVVQHCITESTYIYWKYDTVNLSPK